MPDSEVTQQTCAACGKLHELDESHHWGDCCSLPCMIERAWEDAAADPEPPTAHQAGHAGF